MSSDESESINDRMSQSLSCRSKFDMRDSVFEKDTPRIPTPPILSNSAQKKRKTSAGDLIGNTQLSSSFRRKTEFLRRKPKRNPQEPRANQPHREPARL